VRRVTEVAGPHDTVSVRRVLLDDFEPGLAPDERCRRFLALPEHEWRVLGGISPRPSGLSKSALPGSTTSPGLANPGGDEMTSAARVEAREAGT
jgi:hypothetical protein